MAELARSIRYPRADGTGPSSGSLGPLSSLSSLSQHRATAAANAAAAVAEAAEANAVALGMQPSAHFGVGRSSASVHRPPPFSPSGSAAAAAGGVGGAGAALSGAEPWFSLRSHSSNDGGGGGNGRVRMSSGAMGGLQREAFGGGMPRRRYCSIVRTDRLTLNLNRQ